MGFSTQPAGTQVDRMLRRRRASSKRGASPFGGAAGRVSRRARVEQRSSSGAGVKIFLLLAWPCSATCREATGGSSCRMMTKTWISALPLAGRWDDLLPVLLRGWSD